MFRIDHPTAVGVLPAPAPAGAPGYFKQNDPGVGPSTVVTDDWANMVQEELVGVVTGAGLALDKANHGQVLAAIQTLLDASGVTGAGSIFGLTTSNAAGFETSRITISTGLCRDTTNTAKLNLAAPITKRLDQAWAVGNNNGGRDAGALANGQTWHIFLILRPDTGVVDALFSQSPTAPTLPANYTKFRRIGSVILEAASTNIRLYNQTGNWFMLQFRSTDFAAAANAGGPFLRLISVPEGIRVRAKLYFQSIGGTIDANPYLSGVFDPAFGAPPAFGPGTQWAQIRRRSLWKNPGTWESYESYVIDCFTDTSRHVYTFSSEPTTELLALGVLGWEDDRGRLF